MANVSTRVRSQAAHPTRIAKLHTLFRLPLFTQQRQPENHYPCINLSVLNSKCRPAAAG
ncbi:hypothetical protein [Kingella oralis]|uniref:hypothetical protein n=1 Tax=Kingella oralis TaxID=505 RepID=UPI002D7E299D|nr:hypothetical protein [Kingella oralis]